MVWDERYRYLRGLYDDANPEQSQEADTIYGPMLSLQSHFVW